LRCITEGSLSKAAKTLGMSYKKAWNLVDSINKNAINPIVITNTGGSGGGGTIITEYGIKMIAAFENINKNCWNFLDEQDKGLKFHQGIPFIQHILNAMNVVTNEILIVTDNLRYKVFGYPCISDMIPNQGPIGGIYTGLTHTKTSLNLVLSCDIPFITAQVLQNLIADYDSNYDVIMYEDTPLIALYHTVTKDRFFESIQTNDLRLRKTLSRLKVKNIPIDKSILPFVKNINTPAQYKDAVLWK